MSTKATFETFASELNRLVEIFRRNLAHYKGGGYDEANLRKDFLDPFFRALGWDMDNRAGHIPKDREVEIESRTQIGGRNKRADYLFRAGGRERFVCEAKKPAEELDARHAFQAKRYAWNKDLPVAILSDFEELKVYVVGGKPRSDEPETGLWKSWHFLQFPLVARELWDILSRDAVAAGAVDRLIESLPRKAAGKGKARQQWLIKPDRSRALDAEFLNFLDEARQGLASDLYRLNDHDALLADNRLNEAVHRILDRLLFLRICEDRDIDTGTLLASIAETWRRNYGKETGRKARQQSLFEAPPAYQARAGVPADSLWSAIVAHFRALDRRPPSHVPFFNGNLFKPHFSEELAVGDEWLADFISEISDEESPYLFDVIPVEILGTIYERFLGKVVRPKGRGITVEEKPEVRKAGGVYYTPRYIVDYIVEQTVGKLLDEIAGSGPARTAILPLPAGEGGGERARPVSSTVSLKDFTARTADLRLLDPACGSGSFLIRAYERVCEHWQKRLTHDLRAALDEADLVGRGVLTAPPSANQRAQTPPDGALGQPRPTSNQATLAAWRKKHRPLCWVDDTTGDVHLTVDLKRRILTDNIYGVDLDGAAVEVTQLSLYLKMLEDENRTTLARERELFPEAIALLPPLQDNIKCGNSLIASDFSMMPEDLVRVRAFDWPVQFPHILGNARVPPAAANEQPSGGGKSVGRGFRRDAENRTPEARAPQDLGFDAVIGNPPYIRIQTMQESDAASVEYLNQTYTAAKKGNYDIYVCFVERALALVNPNGTLGFILPHKFFNAQYGEGLREVVASGKHIRRIVHFGHQQIFEGATTYTSLLFLNKSPQPGFDFVSVADLSAWAEKGVGRERRFRASVVTSSEWIFNAGPDAGLIERLFALPVKLSDVAHLFVGLQTDADDVFIVELASETSNELVCFSRATEKEHRFEREHLKLLLKGSLNVRRYELDSVTKRLIFPYETVGNASVLISEQDYKKRFPKTWRYLEENRDRLSKRNKGKQPDGWHGYIYKKNHTRLGSPKIVVPSIGTGSCFALDSTGRHYFVGSGAGGGGGYGILPTNKDIGDIRFLLVLLNSRLLSFLIRKTSTPFRGGYIALNRQYIERLPIQLLDLKNRADKARHDKLVALVDKMLGLMPKLRAAASDSERAILQNAITATDQQIDALVYDLYCLTPEEIQLVERAQ